MREYSAESRSHARIQHSVRRSMIVGTCSRATAMAINEARAKQGLPQIDLSGIRTPAETKLAARKAAANAETRARQAIAKATTAQSRCR